MRILTPHDYVAPHLTAGEVFDFRDITEPTIDMVHPCLLMAWELVRGAWGKPLTVNSGVRSHGKQMYLLANGVRAAEFSPHVAEFGFTTKGWGMIRPCLALDLDTSSAKESRDLAACIRETAPLARVFWKRYLPQTFVHFDVAPVLRFTPDNYLANGETELPPSWLVPGLGD